MAVNTNQYAVQAVFEIDVFDLEDGALLARLEELKSTNWQNSGEIVYSQGGRGNPKIIGFGHSKSSMLECQNAIITEGALGIQTGSGVEELSSTTDVKFSEILTVTTNSATTTYTATGVAGAEIGYVYKLNDDGSIGAKIEQGAAVATGTFTYTPLSKTLTFEDTPAQYADGTKIVVFYNPTISDAKKVTNRTDVFAKNVMVRANGLFRDVCNGKDYAGQLIFYKAKTSEEYNIELSADGEPAVHNISWEALKSCTDNILWDLIIYNPEDIA